MKPPLFVKARASNSKTTESKWLGESPNTVLYAKQNIKQGSYF